MAKTIDLKGFTAAELSRYRQFYHTYPHILGTLSQEFKSLMQERSIFATLSQKSQNPSKDITPELISRLSFSHFVELIKIPESEKRYFYEVQAIKGTWSVRELKRQIGSLYYERAGLSLKSEEPFIQTATQITPQKPEEIVKDYCVFEFLDLPSKHKVSEQDLETALLDHIQHVILELEEGFCFEARQKRLLIGDEYYFVDLVFYHRILKCHVLIELKVEAFSHGHMGQLNTYLNYYNDQIKQADDKPAIGLLLVTDQNETLVNYATAGMEEPLFVKNYKLQLPAEQEIKAAILAYLKT